MSTRTRFEKEAKGNLEMVYQGAFFKILLESSSRFNFLQEEINETRQNFRCPLNWKENGTVVYGVGVVLAFCWHYAPRSLVSKVERRKSKKGDNIQLNAGNQIKINKSFIWFSDWT